MAGFLLALLMKFSALPNNLSGKSLSARVAGTIQELKDRLFHFLNIHRIRARYTYAGSWSIIDLSKYIYA